MPRTAEVRVAAGGNTRPHSGADWSVALDVLLVSGSLRRLSTNRAVLRTAAGLAPAGLTTHTYDELNALPAFNPDDDQPPLPPAVERLRQAVHHADAILFSTPEYAAALPGSLKNLLDWTIGDDQPGSIYGKPVGWLNASPRGARGAHHELRTVLAYAHAYVVEAACVDVPVTPEMIGSDGSIHDERIRAAVRRVLETLAAVRRP